MDARISAGRAWTLHLGAFVLPLGVTAYLLTGPHSLWAVPLALLSVGGLVVLEGYSPDENNHPKNTAKWLFDLQLVALAALQLGNHVLLGVMARRASTANLPQLLCALIVTPYVSGLAAGYTGFVLAHELIHRRNRFLYGLGRLLFACSLYEHWPHEHVRGHHPRVAMQSDWSTAQFGESFRDYLRRTLPGKWKSAWRLEAQRVGSKRWFDLRNRVLQGVIVELCIVLGYLLVFGWVAVVLFFLQTRMAIMLLEAVDYIEHWGLRREPGEKVSRRDSWDCNNAMTLYTLIGLSRHPDHHARASRPYQLLQRAEESPQMPYGYYAMIVLAWLRNKRYRELATAELERKQLGPFRPVGAT